MEPAYDTTAPKKAANLSINSDLLQQARGLKINLSQALEDHLAELVRQKRRQQWLRENRDAIDAYNQKVAASGVFSDPLRSF
jgi:antitoxin CcdA